VIIHLDIIYLKYKT